MVLTSRRLEKIPGIVHGFGTLDEPYASFVLKAQERSPQWDQVHGVDFAEVTEYGQSCGSVDALYTQISGIPISVKTADCVPLLLVHQEGNKVAAIHAGWKGTKARIVERFWKQLESEGENPRNWVAAIGPCIGSCCFEVSEDLAQEFCREFKEVPQSVMNPRFRYLDLPAIHRHILKEIGFAEVDILPYCTKCSTHPLFSSYRAQRRKEGKLGQYSSIMKWEP